MFTVFEQPPEFSKLNANAMEVLKSIWQGLELNSQAHSFVQGEEVNCQSADSAVLHYIEDGYVQVLHGTKSLYFLEPGEIFGDRSLLSSDIRYICPDKALTQRVSTREFFQTLQQSPKASEDWLTYQSLRLNLFDHIISRSAPEADNPFPIIRSYNPGEPILIQETSADEVFTLLHGSADVFVNDVQVGQVLEGEIFGALAATTNSRRSASIISNAFSVVSVLPQSEYMALMRTHPKTMHETMASMARIIVAQNEKIVSADA